jgi:hypothetical protein
VPLSVTLLELRRLLRSETGTSLNPQQGVQAQDTLDLILARQQRELWDAYNWQHLKIWTDVPLTGGQSLYSYPVQMAFDQITRVYVTLATYDTVIPDQINSAGAWEPLAYGIKPFMLHLGPARVGKPMRWGNVASINTTGPTPITNPVGQFQLLPTPPPDTGAIPKVGYVLRFEGQAPLSPLVAPTDTCILDSEAIVLFAAAEILATQKSEAAPMKLTKAQNYLRRILADQGADKRVNYNMGGNHRGGIDPDKSYRRIPYIDYIPS